VTIGMARLAPCRRERAPLVRFCPRAPDTLCFVQTDIEHMAGQFIARRAISRLRVVNKASRGASEVSSHLARGLRDRLLEPSSEQGGGSACSPEGVTPFLGSTTNGCGVSSRAELFRASKRRGATRDLGPAQHPTFLLGYERDQESGDTPLARCRRAEPRVIWYDVC
jgi:hypothetical protein